MPRPKGSKNKAKAVIENVDEKIAAVEAEIAKLTADLKEKKTELKKLVKAKAEADKVGIPMLEREFHCKGEFKGIHKGKPDQEDLKAVVDFARKIKKQFED